jgi:3-methyladenine DNA glycosylase/8-oxoguanine DNA glycosylase
MRRSEAIRPITPWTYAEVDETAFQHACLSGRRGGVRAII